MSWLCDRPCDNKTDFGYCKTTYCIYGTTNQFGATGYVPPLKKTNADRADRIRAMSDEDLCVWLNNFAFATAGKPATARRHAIRNELLNWLKQEAAE